MEGLEETYDQIIKDSTKKLSVVKMLAHFFNHKDLFAVYIRTKVIHNLFESNKNLDANKLELFHVQYTSTLIELFQKIKKAKEQQYLLITDEIYINDDLIKKLERETDPLDFQQAAKQHASKMSKQLKGIYAMLVSGNDSTAIGWAEIMTFSATKGNEFYRDLSHDSFLALAEFEGRKTYETNQTVIEKKLMGKLNKFNFRIKFACGFRFQNDYLEVFDFVDSNEKFVFINSTKSFYLFNDELATGLDLSKNVSNKIAIIIDLKNKNEELSEKLATIKTTIPDEVEEVLQGYLEKISGVDFLEELQNVDEQTNILRAMLNININTNSYGN